MILQKFTCPFFNGWFEIVKARNFKHILFTQCELNDKIYNYGNRFTKWVCYDSSIRRTESLSVGETNSKRSEASAWWKLHIWDLNIWIMPAINSMNKVRQYFEVCGNFQEPKWWGCPVDLSRDTCSGRPPEFSDESRGDGKRQRKRISQRCSHLIARNFRVQQ